MRWLAIYFIRLANSIFQSGQSYIRLSPNTSGRIYFFDKQKKKFFYVFSRGWIDSVTADHIYTNHDYDLRFLKRYDELVESYKRIVDDNKVPLIIDCGANIGLSSRYFAEQFSGSRVIAVEPEGSNFEMMNKNCSNFDNIFLENCAIGAFKGYVSISNEGADPNAFRTCRGSDSDGIKVVTIGDLIDQESDTQPFIVKIDIEGFESDLFSGNTEWLRRVPIVVIETHDWMLPKEANSQNFLKAISQEDRDFIHRGENIFSIANWSWK